MRLRMLTVYRSETTSFTGAGLVLAHGAGAGQTSRFMIEAGHAFAARGITTATFDFPYVAEGRKVPDKAPVLETAWRAAIAAARADRAFARLPLFIGGKSMGGRIASHVAAQGIEGIRGLLFLGYPLHPPGRPEQRRDKHLPAIREPMLFVQGSRDQFGTAQEIRDLLPLLNPRATLFEVVDGDHSFKIRVKIAGRKQDEVLAGIFDAASSFLLGIARE
ncbi:MAG TPA: alpha/beta family hydrolase [Vicinamibacterales bacterium]|nr:alpha/beta family hydrolase [Vicinamibacterales bacterium]